MYKLFKLINNEIIFGSIEVVKNDAGGGEILIKTPWTAKNTNILPYMMDEMAEPIGAVQIHPMNILWSCDLTEFKEAYEAYIKATTGLDTSVKKIIV